MARVEPIVTSEHLLGAKDFRRRVAGVVIGLLVLASAGFVLGLDVGLSLGWVGLALVIAIAAGAFGAGLGPTIGSLWLIGLWWFVFPPLVGWLSGRWAASTRYHHPRMMGFGYTSARAELLGGLEYGFKYGLLFAVIGGALGYLSGIALVVGKRKLVS